MNPAICIKYIYLNIHNNPSRKTPWNFRKENPASTQKSEICCSLDMRLCFLQTAFCKTIFKDFVKKSVVQNTIATLHLNSKSHLVLFWFEYKWKAFWDSRALISPLPANPAWSQRSFHVNTCLQIFNTHTHTQQKFWRQITSFLSLHRVPQGLLQASRGTQQPGSPGPAAGLRLGRRDQSPTWDSDLASAHVPRVPPTAPTTESQRWVPPTAPTTESHQQPSRLQSRSLLSHAPCPHGHPPPTPSLWSKRWIYNSGTYYENTYSGSIDDMTLVQFPMKPVQVWSMEGLQDEAENHILLIWITPGALHSY